MGFRGGGKSNFLCMFANNLIMIILYTSVDNWIRYDCREMLGDIEIYKFTILWIEAYFKRFKMHILKK